MKIVWCIALLSAAFPALADKSFTDYPQLKHFFPFGVYVAAERIADWGNPDAPVHYGRPMIEPYRRDLEDMAKHYINLVAIENTACIPVKVMKQMLAEAERFEIFTWASENALPPDSEAESYAQRRISQFRDEKGLLVWSPWDEPYPEHMERWLLWKKAFEAADPNHPVIAVTCGGPKGFENHDVIQASDYYPIYAENADPWSVRAFVRRYVEATSKPNWFVVQAFQGEGRRLPTIAESRMMTYMALGEGAKGILYFIYDHSVTHYNHPVTPQWDDIGQLGRILRAVGPELLDTQIDYNSMLVELNAKPNQDTRRPKDWPPAVCSVLPSPQGHAFVVVYNTSTESTAEVTLKCKPSYRLYDLQSLVETNQDPTAKQIAKLRLNPGDGRMFLLDGGKNYKRITSSIRSNLYQAEKALLRGELDLAVSWNLKLSEVNRLIERSVKALNLGDPRKALNLILEARAALENAQESNYEFSTTRKLIDRICDELWNLESALARFRSEYPERWEDKMKWPLDEFISRFLEIDQQFHEGEKSVKKQAERLLEDIAQEINDLTAGA